MQQEKQDEAETCISSACVEESSIKYGASQTSRKKQEGGHMYCTTGTILQKTMMSAETLLFVQTFFFFETVIWTPLNVSLSG